MYRYARSTTYISPATDLPLFFGRPRRFQEKLYVHINSDEFLMARGDLKLTDNHNLPY